MLASSKRYAQLAGRLGESWVYLFLVFLVVLFGFTGRGFFAVKTLNNVLISSSPALLLAAAETFVIITGGIDLSVGFVRGLVSVVAAIVMRDLFAMNFSPALSIFCGVLVGLGLSFLPGLLSGVLIAKFKVPPFIATLGTYGIANGFALRYSKGFPVTFLPPQVGEIGNGFLIYYFPGEGFSFFKSPIGFLDERVRDLIGIGPYAILVVGAILYVFAFLLSRTQFGQHTYAIGGSIDAARRAGINVERHLIKIYVISSFLSGLSGIMSIFIFSIGTHTQFASSLELFAIAAVVVGGASLMGGKGSVAKTAVGVFILSVLEVGFLTSGIMPFYRYIAVGGILIFAVIVDQILPELGFE